MEEQAQGPAQEAKHLRRCINDLVSLLALPAIWTGGDPSQVLHTLVDALMRTLSLDVISVRLLDPVRGAPVEIVRIARLEATMLPTHEICEALTQLSADKSQKWPPLLRQFMGDGDVSITRMPLGLQGEFGVIVAAAQRADFPQQSETLLLNVAANQACIGLQEARLRNQQKRIADELDQRVAQRTAELAAANAELQLQVGLLQHLPASAWTLKPDGMPDFVNQVWLEFSGQTLDFIRSHPEAWMTAVHPDDREAASRAFWDGVRSGQGFAIETRSLRARDGIYRWHLQQAAPLRDAEGKILKFVGTTTDIDDQKRAEEEVRASEHNLRRVIDAIPTLAWCNLPDGPNEFLNKGWHEYTGLSEEESHGWGWTIAFHPEDLPPLMAKWEKMLVSGESDEIEARLRRHDGVYRWFLIRAQAFRDESGKIIRWYGTSTDIDDRKRAEEELRASETNLREIVDCIPGLVCTMDAAGDVEQLNRPLLEYFGKTPDELKAWQMTDAVHPDDIAEVVKAFTNSVKTGTPYDVEQRCRRADGAYRWFQVRGFPARGANGKIAGWYFLLYDIDDRKHAEEKLRRSEALLAQVQSVSLTGGFSWRVDTDEVTFSEEAYRIFEFEKDMPVTLEQVRGRVHPEDTPLFSELMAGARSAQWTDLHYEIRLEMPDGSIKYLYTISHEARDHEGRLEYVGAIQDITRRRLSEEALSKARLELAKVTGITSLGVLTASIAHEVNQPLSGIVTNAATCLRMLDANPPNLEGARETARRTIRDGHRASDVITRLRTLYSKKEPAVEPMDLNEAAREVTVLSLSELQRGGVVLRVDFAGALPPVLGDRIQLQQVILNLLRNAIDAMSTIDDRPRELLIRTEMDRGNQVRLSVKDSGVGLTAEAGEKIFQAFYTTKTEGMGIGLSISRSIIEAHQGHLWATRNDGPGSTFSFSIPCRVEGLADVENSIDGADPSAAA